MALSSISFSKDLLKPKQERKTCESAREFISTVEYLKNNKDFQISKKDLIKVGMKVSTGCSGASNRFFKIVKILTKSGLDTKSSIETGILFVSKTDVYTKTFINIFKKAFQEGDLNLDLYSSLKIAKNLSVEFDGDLEKVISDFNSLISLCNEKKFGLTLRQCSVLANQVTKAGENYDQNISEPFSDLFTFLRDNKSGPQITTGSSLSLALEIIKFGPLASKNFKNSYKYAIGKSGLNYQAKDALNFAKEISSHSFQIQNE